MTIEEIESFYRGLVDAAYAAAAAAPEMTPEEAQKLESDIDAALSVVMTASPGSYPLDLAHKIALGLFGQIALRSIYFDPDNPDDTILPDGR